MKGTGQSAKVGGGCDGGIVLDKRVRMLLSCVDVSEQKFSDIESSALITGAVRTSSVHASSVGGFRI